MVWRDLGDDARAVIETSESWLVGGERRVLRFCTVLSLVKTNGGAWQSVMLNDDCEQTREGMVYCRLLRWFAAERVGAVVNVGRRIVKVDVVKGSKWKKVG